MRSQLGNIKILGGFSGGIPPSAAAAPGGSDGNPLFNSANTIGGMAGVIWDPTLRSLTSSQATSAVSADGIVLATTSVATVGAQKYSQRVRWTGSGWKTTATAAAQVVDFIAELQPVQGTNNPSANLVLSSRINGGSFLQCAAFDSACGLQLGSLGNTGTLTLGNAAGTSYMQGESGMGTFGGYLTGFNLHADMRISSNLQVQGSLLVGNGLAFTFDGTNALKLTNDLGSGYRDIKLRGVWYGSTLTVGTLPSAASFEGLILRVSDALAPAVGATVTAGGATKCSVQSNASTWQVIYIA